MLDEEIGWDRLVASREEIAALGDLATQDPLSLATKRYARLRRFAPATSGWKAARTTVDSTPISCPWTKRGASSATANWKQTGRPVSQAGARGSTTGYVRCATA